MSVCVIDIADGIGNIIQSIPFIVEMKKKYNKVIGHNRPDFPESVDIVRHLYDGLRDKGDVGRCDKYYPIPNLSRMGSYSEYRSWFKYHKEQVPKFFVFDVAHKEMDDKYDMVIWPECKPQWRSKQWPYWNELVQYIQSMGVTYRIAVVGSDKNGMKIDGVDDLRGKLTLMETGGIIKNTCYYIGNEGGISHYANALGKNVYIIYGGTDVVKNMPPSRNGLYRVSLGLDCQPCQFGMCKSHPARGCQELDCLTLLKPRVVGMNIMMHILGTGEDIDNGVIHES